MSAGIPAHEARLDADLLARHVLGWDRATLVARAGDPLPGGFADAFAALIQRRTRREPIAYIAGTQEFWGRDFAVGPDVLIPRPETELLVEESLDWARGREAAAPCRVADVGTGSGCLAITLALELPETSVDATDTSPQALIVAAANARRLGAAVTFHHGRTLDGVAAPLDLIVANPPYITAADFPTLQPEVRVHEPRTALVGGDAGLEVIREIVEASARALAPGGRMLIEIGYGQADAVRRIVADTERLVVLRIRDDLQGIARAVVAARSGAS